MWCEYAVDAEPSPTSYLVTSGLIVRTAVIPVYIGSAAPDSKVEINYPADIHASVLAGERAPERRLHVLSEA